MAILGEGRFLMSEVPLLPSNPNLPTQNQRCTRKGGAAVEQRESNLQVLVLTPLNTSSGRDCVQSHRLFHLRNAKRQAPIPDLALKYIPEHIMAITFE